MPELHQAGQEELVLHDAMLQAARLRLARDGERIGEVGRGRLLAIDVLAGGERLPDQLGPHLRRAGIEEELVLAVGERGGEVRRPALDLVPLRQRLDLLRVAPDQDRIGHHPVAVRQRHAAIGADGEDGADQMLVRPHAPADAVHDDAEPARGHASALLCLIAGLGLVLSNRVVTCQGRAQAGY